MNVLKFEAINDHIVDQGQQDRMRQRARKQTEFIRRLECIIIPKMTRKTISAGDYEVTNISGLLVKQPPRNCNCDILLKNRN